MPDFPRAQIDPAAVWNFSTRTLTGFTGQARADLVGLDEPVYTRLDVPVSTRSSHTAADVWAVATRTLTSLAGQPRIDIWGEDASFEAGTGLRKTRIDRLANMDAFDTPIEGTLTADGTEQNLVLDEIPGNPPRFLDGYVDLSAMAEGDTVVIRQYVSLVTPVSYKKYAEETFSGPQALPLLYITTKTGRYGIKVTLQQTAGTFKTFPFQFFRRRVA
jgi:hypothetical protein